MDQILKGYDFPLPTANTSYSSKKLPTLEPSPFSLINFDNHNSNLSASSLQLPPIKIPDGTSFDPAYISSTEIYTTTTTTLALPGPAFWDSRHILPTQHTQQHARHVPEKCSPPSAFLQPRTTTATTTTPPRPFIIIPSNGCCYGGSSSTSSLGIAGGQQISKKPRKKVTPAQLAILEAAFQKGMVPDLDTRNTLAGTLGFSERRVRVWFQNRRAKLKKDNQRSQVFIVNKPGEVLSD